MPYIFVGATNGKILNISGEKRRFEPRSRCNRRNAKIKKKLCVIYTCAYTKHPKIIRDSLIDSLTDFEICQSISVNENVEPHTK